MIRRESRPALRPNRFRHIGLLALALLIATPLRAAPQWIEHSSTPGPDIPPAGQSRFDDLFGEAGGGYRIPYPFDALIELLEAKLDTASGAGVRRVFVPHGRSLQRESAAPDYFLHPRDIITLEGEPRVASPQAGRVLEYRLFVAHAPASESLEVISYNDAAGRFEFQIVEGYAADRVPRVLQASRVMCLSCHQSAAPIFARRPWSETSFNVAVARRMREARPERYDSWVDLVTPDADLIDVMVERANYLSVAQQVWRDACSDRACRAALLRAVLQYRLSDETSFDQDHAGYREAYRLGLERNWPRVWPEGLALAKSRIPDRDPFGAEAADYELDPLFERSPHAVWRRADAVLTQGIVYRLAGFLTQADILRLDRHLIERSASGEIATTRYRSPCRREANGDAQRLYVCAAEGADGGPRIRIRVEGSAEIEELRIDSLQLPGDRTIRQPGVAHFEVSAHRIDIVAGASGSSLSARGSNGDRIGAVRLIAPDGETATVEIEMVHDFALLDAAIGRLRDAEHVSLGAAPFRRDRVLPALRRELGMPALAWPQEPLPRAAPAATENPSLAHNLALLNPYCAACHAADSRNPPGFLYGAEASRRVAQCAPRILARLHGWRSFPRVRRSPMPPPASLPATGSSREAWPHSDHFRALYAAVEQLRDRDYSAIEYDALPPCLPPG